MGQRRSKILLWDELERNENNSLPLTEANPYQSLVEYQLTKQKGGPASKASGRFWIYYMWPDVDGYC